MLKELSGRVERILFHNEENGYTVAKIKARELNSLITVVGNLLNPVPGTTLKIKGEWIRHPKFGKQFKISQYETVVPETSRGISNYLGSGLIKGLGPVMAERIVKQFGRKTLEILNKNPEKLSLVEGIGKKRISMIKKAWDEQAEVRSLSIFLHTHDIGSRYIRPVYKAYGTRAIDVIRANPFKLAGDIPGIGFKSADQIARKLGLPKDSPTRIDAGVLFVLNQCVDEGHVFFPFEALVKKSREILSVHRDSIIRTLGRLAETGQVVIEDQPDRLAKNLERGRAVYLSWYHVCEKSVARRLNALRTSSRTVNGPMDSKRAVQWVQKALALTLVDAQIKAVNLALHEKVLIITGGPGTGKTTILQAILKIYSKLNTRMELSAPTGRAAKRMSEATGYKAKTIHRLLSYSYSSGGFKKNEKNPLKVDLVIVDEVSMIDIVLMHHLLKAIPRNAVLILVGDVNQLPSVGAGNVLNDMIESGVIRVVELTEIFRQAEKSQIIFNAHRINQGNLPLLKPSLPGNKNISDFYFIDQENPGKVLELILELVKKRIPRRFGLDPFEDIQVLTPMHKGLLGSDKLNESLQEILNPEGETVHQGGRNFRVHDKVMQIRNNYDKEVFNGDIGKVSEIDLISRELTVVYDLRPVRYGFEEMDEIVPAYAISIHKSQGSEYPAVVIPIMTQHFILLQRNLIYTAITRGTRLVVIIGTRKALTIGVKNNKTLERYSSLKIRLSDH